MILMHLRKIFVINLLITGVIIYIISIYLDHLGDIPVPMNSNIPKTSTLSGGSIKTTNLDSDIAPF